MKRSWPSNQRMWNAARSRLSYASLRLSGRLNITAIDKEGLGMNYRHIASSVFALGAMVASAQAFAADSVYGGGATFPALYYRQVFDCLYNPVGTDTSPSTVTCPHNAA